MNILHVVPYPPSLVRVRPYQLIHALVRRGHRLTVLTVWTGEKELADIETLKAAGVHVRAFHLPAAASLRNSGRALLAGEPMQSRFSWHAGLASEIKKLLCGGRWDEEVVDLVHVEHLRGVHYAWTALSCKHQKPPRVDVPVVWDSVDCISHLFELASRQGPSLKSRLLARLELMRTRTLEARAASSFDQVLVTSPADRSAFLCLAGAGLDPGRVQVIPNGVDLEYFQPGPESARHAETLVVSGKMSYHANIAMVRSLVEEILPLVRVEIPGVKLVIAGQDPPPVISKMASIPGITVTGRVPDLRPFLQEAAVAVVPLVYGAGIQNKVLEAMACATPVVASRQAAGALSARPGKEVMVAEDEASFARDVISLLRNPLRQAELGQAGRAYVEKHHSWDQIAARLEGIYLGLVHHTPLGIGIPYGID